MKQHQAASYRGVVFKIRGNSSIGYDWNIHPSSRAGREAIGGRVEGPSAFRRAYNGIQVSVDAWLLNHPDDGEPADDQPHAMP